MSDFDIDAWTDSVENGDIALTELDEVPGGGDDRDRHAANLLEPHAAANMGLLLAAAKDAGMALAIHYSYRDLPTQVKKHEAFLRGDGNLAATPGHSNHGWALAVDFDIDVEDRPEVLSGCGRTRSRTGSIGTMPTPSPGIGTTRAGGQGRLMT